MNLPIYEARAASILSPTTGFIKDAGFTRSLTPARNCTYGCTYCYVPTLRIYAGLKPDDWKRWGQFTTYKQDAAGLLEREVRPEHLIYCSPLVDPYQPAETEARAMPAILEALVRKPPKVFVLQTRGPLVLRDLTLLQELRRVTTLRVSFSLTTNREEVRRLYEPHCATFEERLRAMAKLAEAGIDTFATLAPILPCDPEVFARSALDVTSNDIIGDPLHTRGTKRFGATTRAAADAISDKHGFVDWHKPAFQESVIQRIRAVVQNSGRKFETGPEGFSWLTRM